MLFEPAHPAPFDLAALRGRHWPVLSGCGIAYHQALAAASLLAGRGAAGRSADRLMAGLACFFAQRDQGDSCLPPQQLPELWRERVSRAAHPLPEAAEWEPGPDFVDELAALGVLDRRSPDALDSQAAGGQAPDGALVESGAPAADCPLALADFGAGPCLYLAADLKLEGRIAALLAERCRPAESDPAFRAGLGGWLDALPPGAALDPLQRQAVLDGCDRPLFVLNGGPGTGKTTTVFHLLRAQYRLHRQRYGDAPRIALCAPTGRAAARLGESLRAGADKYRSVLVDGADRDFAAAMSSPGGTTLHRLLGLRDGFADRPDDAELPFDIVVADEASMVDLFLMERLLARLSPAARLVLVGDPWQLPSVECGSALAELASPLLEGQVPRTTLRTVFRSRGAILDCSRELLAGDADAALARAEAGPPGLELRRLPEASRQEQFLAAAVREWLAAGGASECAAACAAAGLDRPALARLYARLGDAVLLSPYREGRFGTIKLNRLVAEGLDRQAPSKGGRAGRWFPGQMVMVTKNDYERGLYNGDRGLVYRGGRGLAVYFPDWDEGKGPDPAPQTVPGLEPAFALTIHKSQGSEYGSVWLFLDAAADPQGALADRALLYTGATRAKSALRLLVDPAGFARACAQDGGRRSNLAARLARLRAT